jgi:hypothetical protein
MKKISMFSDGTIVVAEGNKFRKASSQEAQSFLKTASDEDTSKYLSNVFPKEKDGNELTHVRLDKETGYAYGKYANTTKVLRKKIMAQSQARQTEPVNSIDKADPKVEIPRNEKKNKPQEFTGREDVNSPKEVRKDNYDMGPGGKNLHTNVVPRDKGGDGIGGESTNFEDEKGKDATSGNPDNYVQEFQENEKPESAGSEKNHAVAATKKPLDVKFASEELRFKFAKDSDDKDHKNEEKDEENDKKPKKNLPPWLKDKKKDGDEDKKSDKKSDEESDEKASKDEKETKAEVVEFKQKLAFMEKQIQKLEKEISNRKIAEARKEAAIGLVLAYRDRQPEKYASANAFNEKVVEISKKMSVEAIDNAMEEFNSLVMAESDRQKKIAQSASQLKQEGGSLSHPIVIPQSNYKFASSSHDTEDLASILMQNTTLGKSVSNMTRYHEQLNEKD